ncbi:MAG TPA: hypothetical protein VGR81_13330 [Candidatus Acidoferrales bacterium]|nr:hypothetical protein [Candidatus Acidoferrales bacterium]
MLPQRRTLDFQAQPADDFVRTLSDAELVDKCVQGFRKLRELVPYLREARRRWAQPGRQVPVPGRPCWTEWIKQNLHVSPRRVQQLLSEPSEISSRGQKAQSRLAKGDWRALLMLTENQMAKVFGPLESGERFAKVIQSFAQAVADRFGERHGRVEVSVAVTSRGNQNSRAKQNRRAVARTQNSAMNGSATLPPILPTQKPFPQDCGGCADMHYGIAKFIAKNGGTDEETAKACGVSLAIVRQARVRHALMLGDSPENGRNGH